MPSALKIELFGKGVVELVEIKLEEGSPLIGRALNSIPSKLKVKLLVCAVQRREEVYIPSGDFVLQPGDRIHITASHADMEAVFRALGILRQRIKAVVIVGGGKIAYYLARQILASGMHVKIIEQSQERCEFLSSLLPKADIICGDGTDQELLREEGLRDADAFVSLTGFDEENIILAMYASTQGVPKVICKINRLSLLGILGDTGIETIVSPKLTSTNQILSYVRGMQNSMGSNVETLYKIVDGKAGGAGVPGAQRGAFLKVPLKKLELKANLLIACILRRGRVIFPGGDDAIELGDTVIVITTNPHLFDLADIVK